MGVTVTGVLTAVDATTISTKTRPYADGGAAAATLTTAGSTAAVTTIKVVSIIRLQYCILGAVIPVANIVTTRRMPVQRAALCIRNFPSQYRTHFRGLSGHNDGRFNATVFISMLSGGELAFPLIARQPLTRHC